MKYLNGVFVAVVLSGYLFRFSNLKVHFHGCTLRYTLNMKRLISIAFIHHTLYYVPSFTTGVIAWGSFYRVIRVLPVCCNIVTVGPYLGRLLLPISHVSKSHLIMVLLIGLSILLFDIGIIIRYMIYVYHFEMSATKLPPSANQYFHLVLSQLKTASPV